MSLIFFHYFNCPIDLPYISIAIVYPKFHRMNLYVWGLIFCLSLKVLESAAAFSTALLWTQG